MKKTEIDFSLPVLSIRQPWAWFILNVGKDIENRDWYTKYRGRFLIHAGKGCTKEEFSDAVYTAQFAYNSDKYKTPPKLPGLSVIERGGIVGSVELVDCVAQSPSKWFFGTYGFVLRDPQIHPFYECKGQLGFFKVQP
ncbi:MAG: ASCH domain-containing protein [Victivallales bacterium]